jgi:hypothetical protein
MICYECYYPESKALVENPVLIIPDALLAVTTPVIGISQFIDHASTKTVQFSFMEGSFMYIHWIVQLVYMYVLACVFVTRKKKMKK